MMPRSTPDIRRISQPSLQAVMDSVERPFVYQRNVSSAVPMFEGKGMTSRINSGSIPPAFHYQSAPLLSDDRNGSVEEGSQFDTEYPGAGRFPTSDIDHIGKGVLVSRNDRQLSDLQASHDTTDTIHESITSDAYTVPTGPGETGAFQQQKSGSFQEKNHARFVPSSSAFPAQISHADVPQKNFSDRPKGQAVVPLSIDARAEKKPSSPDGKTAKKTGDRDNVFENSLERSSSRHHAVPGMPAREDKAAKVSHTLREVVEWIEKDPAWHGVESGKENPVLSESVLSPFSLSDTPKKKPAVKDAALQSAGASPMGYSQRPVEPKKQVNIKTRGANLTYLQRSVEAPLSPGRQKGASSEVKREEKQGNESPVKEKIIREIIRVRTPSSNRSQITRGFAQRRYLVRLLRFRGF